MIELVAADMAGTTIEEHGNVYAALRDATIAHGGDISDAQVQDWMGIDKRTALRALVDLGGGGVLDDDAVEEAYVTFRDLLTERYRAEPPSPMPGVPEALARLQADGVRVALTTGFAHDVADPLLASLGWAVGDGLIDAVVCADEVAAGRPAPYLIFRAMEQTGVADVRRVIAVGDTVADLEAATNAGVVAVGVGSGAVPLDVLGTHPHDHLVRSVADLPELVDSLRG